MVYSTQLDPWLDMAALAKHASLSRRTLEAYTRLPVNPLSCCYQIGGKGKLLARLSEADAWLAQHKKPAESDRAASCAT